MVAINVYYDCYRYYYFTGIGVLLHKAAVKLLRPTNLLLLNSNLSKFKLQNFKENLFGNENFKNTFNLEYFPNEEFPCNIMETMAPIDLFLQTSHNRYGQYCIIY